MGHDRRVEVVRGRGDRGGRPRAAPSWTLPVRRAGRLVAGSVALSSVDGRLVTSQGGVYLAGQGAALLLGNLRNDMQARIGLAIVVGGAVTVVYNDPTHQARRTPWFSLRCRSRSVGFGDDLHRNRKTATVRRIHATLPAALNSAVKRRLIPWNPALHVELPTAERVDTRV